ncbi:DNA adenine methylase [Treponema denticola]|uniref:DNA adenine methylase n=1 Tax=Treponema denticola TaxID=158 RepID=UPI00210381E0|nr:DNA adenine methylase [Treponema denticola]UTY27096.1 helix-turn-helix domain-containing protein [Treponema denticola]
MYVGTVLKNIREEQGFSLLEIQRSTGIKENQLSRIESGIRFPTDEQIFILARFYDMDPNQLQILDVTKHKFESKSKNLSVVADLIPGAAIPLESRRYIGCKQKLLDWIFDIIQKETQNIHIATDIFAGTGVVAKKMLGMYDNVIINDFLFSNNQIYIAFFKAGKWNKKKILQKIELYNNLDEKKIDNNYFSLNYGGKYFDYDMAKKIGWIREDIENSKSELTEKEYAVLLATLIYNIDKYANTLGHFEAYIKKPIKKTELKLRLIDVNEFENLTIYREDSNKLAKQIKSDLVYIDPPYNSRQYCRFYHVYETLVKWERPILSGVAMKPPAENMSKYCTSQAPKTFENLIENLDSKYLAVSYNNTYNSKSGSSKNKIELEEIEDVLNTKGETRRFTKDYRFFNAGKTDLENHQELLYITKVK